MNSPEEAVASWNRRAPTINPDDPALVKRCIEVVEELSWTTESIDELTPEATEEIVKAVLAAITKGTT